MNLSDRLDAIKSRSEKATSGPWTDMFIGGPFNPRVDIYTVGREGSHHIEVKVKDEFVQSGFYKKGDAKFIAHSRQDIPLLLALVENYREALEFSKSGCLVPPDGGQPTIQDHIDNAAQALKKGEEMAAEYE